MRLQDLTRTTRTTRTTIRPATTIAELVAQNDAVAEPITIRERYNHEVMLEACPLLSVSVDANGEYNRHTRHERLRDVTRACHLVTARWAATALAGRVSA